VITKSPYNFTNVGGYDNIKQELEQCVDLLSNYSKYSSYNVRIPKGLILEGPPGNGKTMLAKALAGEAKVGFISVSGSQFQDKYIGVGSGRVRELFELAQKNIPCIIFIDEIDALCRKRSGDGETSGSERDNTLNELLVAMDGFKNTSGIFVIGATNRADLLDDALLRPGRIDKRIFISNPDEKTRKAILNIHIKGKPYDKSVIIDDLIETTNGFSGAQLENLLNEAMLNALRENRNSFTDVDVDLVLNKMMVGWQPNEHQFTSDIIDHIAIHELGHAVVGLLSKHHSKMTKIVINLSAPKSPAYTIFESTASNILTREALLEHLMILLSGRIAEEVIYGMSVTTGAINDFEEALKLAQRMICYYGMGKYPIYPSMSEKYKEKIDNEVSKLINDAYAYAEFLVRNSKDLVIEGADILKKQKVMKAEELIELMNEKYTTVLNLKI
jgi:cell division protease FtsH